jgi:hypothetical protein
MIATHKERYPEQYSHEWVGKMAALKDKPEGGYGDTEPHRILRVMPTRFGLLAELENVSADDGGVVAFALTSLQLLKG